MPGNAPAEHFPLAQSASDYTYIFGGSAEIPKMHVSSFALAIAMKSKDDVLKIARLARLNIEPGELEKLTRDFNAILAYVEQLERVDVSGIEPMCHVHGVVNVFREDDVSPSMPVADALGNTPDTHGSFIRVPIIIE